MYLLYVRTLTYMVSNVLKFDFIQVLIHVEVTHVCLRMSSGLNKIYASSGLAFVRRKHALVRTT